MGSWQPAGLATVVGLRSDLARRALRVSDVLQQVWAADARHGDDAIWIERVQPAELLRRAQELDALADRDPSVIERLPLFGVPFAVKGNIDVEGLTTTAACPAFGYRPRRSATAVQRLVDAGALVIGSTNLDQFATGLVGVRSPYGTPVNPVYPHLVPGGSSSGSACAVSAGIVPFSLGTDTAGSGRVPAALQGLVGLKPTRGLVSTSGVVPACQSLDCVSVFGHTVSDAAGVLSILAGPDPGDPWSRQSPPARPIRLPDLRVGLLAATDLEFFGDESMAAAYTAAVQRLGERCGRVVDVPFGPLREAGSLLYHGPWVAERLAGLGDFLAKHADDVLPVTRAIIECGSAFSAVDTFRGVHSLARLAGEVRQWWGQIDVLVVPTVGTAFTPDEIAEQPVARNALLGHYTQFANLLDLAAVTIPAGTTVDGRRPVSLTLLGPAFSDHLLLAAAAQILQEPAGDEPTPGGRLMTVAVAGKHLTGEPRNGELMALGARWLETTVTAPAYRLLALPPRADPLPALMRTSDDDAGRIEVELWAVPDERAADLLALVPPGLALGHVLLADGRTVTGFVGDAYAVATSDAVDLTATGGWRYRTIHANDRKEPCP